MSTELAVLQWYLDAGVDEVIADRAWDRTAAPASLAGSSAPPAPNPGPTATTPSLLPMPAPQAPAALAAELAAIDNLAGLRARLDTFDGCALKATAMNTVYGVGPADADLMIIGEAPGEEEDRKGEPFVGPSGQLLGRMLAAIGLAREQVYITNTIYWRPPGNRTPTPQEVLACYPFMLRQIALIRPKVLMLVGGAAAKTVLQRTEGIMRLRGRWFDVNAEVVAGEAGSPIPAMPTFHPAYLLRSPAQKREAWHDLQAIRDRLTEVAA